MDDSTGKLIQIILYLHEIGELESHKVPKDPGSYIIRHWIVSKEITDDVIKNPDHYKKCLIYNENSILHRRTVVGKS